MSTLSDFTKRQREACAAAADRIDQAIADDRLDHCYLGPVADAALRKYWDYRTPDGVTVMGELGRRRWIGGDVERVAQDLRRIARPKYWPVDGHWRFDIDGLTGAIYKAPHRKWDVFLDDGRDTRYGGFDSLAEAKGYVEIIVAPSRRGDDR